jgi:hypothetical protein
MALKKTVEKSIDGFDTKLIAQDAYWRIDKIEGNKTIMNVTINAYPNSNSGAIINSFMFGFVVEINGNNFICQAYNEAKKLPQFAGATDC